MDNISHALFFCGTFSARTQRRPMYIYQTLFDVRNVETPTATVDSSLIKRVDLHDTIKNHQRYLTDT